jgi:hypothetical protein
MPSWAEAMTATTANIARRLMTWGVLSKRRERSQIDRAGTRRVQGIVVDLPSVNAAKRTASVASVTNEREVQACGFR